LPFLRLFAAIPSVHLLPPRSPLSANQILLHRS